MNRSVSIDVTCLGTSDAFGSVGRHNAGYLVESAEAKVLLDAGPSVLASMKSLGRSPDELDAVVVSHLHGDHFSASADPECVFDGIPVPAEVVNASVISCVTPAHAPGPAAVQLRVNGQHAAGSGVEFRLSIEFPF